ncbi:hypothetical protein VFPFJ_11768 [Purpureocillium lilacinum]|uniref:Uncharacterized protein n=1 Tax=Purpureocillium lilacinum TaxID=33203 RepID=A0A179EW73_PURLI|nr:hypothetical protein VFPFJ_11768 [Purpureocillium lilacinum]OAQ57260.1 hypothetical protein VFPFJ_11768 [Purpureocillium lilacinum]
MAQRRPSGKSGSWVRTVVVVVMATRWSDPEKVTVRSAMHDSVVDSAGGTRHVGLKSAQAAWQTRLESGGTGCSSCCKHVLCIPVRHRQWCRRWFLLRWVSSTTVSPLCLYNELCDLLGPRTWFRVCARESGRGIFDVLLRLDDDACLLGGGASLLTPVPHSSRFEAGLSWAWQLPCCWQAAESESAAWLCVLRYAEDIIPLGSVDLCDTLRNELAGVRKLVEAQQVVLPRSAGRSSSVGPTQPS